MPHDGVVEHNFILQTYLDDARRNQKDICVALLDLSNAFGSIPINLISSSLDRSGIGEDMSSIITDIMSGMKTSIATANGTTEELDVNSGVRQGCPLSGFLFNAGIEPLLRSLVATGKELNPTLRHHCLAYADDITLIAHSPDHIQQLADCATETCRALGLHINPRKCTYMHWSGLQPRGPRHTQLSIDNTQLDALREFEPTKFLGRPIGFNILKKEERIDIVEEKGKKILQSKLAPWQRLDALRSFVLPSLIYPMRTWQYNKTAYERVDRALRPLIKNTLYLPKRAANEYVYGSTANGACGFPMAAEDSDLFLIDTAFKLLTSPDVNTRDLAAKDCSRVAASRMDQEPAPELIPPFMSNEELPKRAAEFQTLWSKTRSAPLRLKVKWSLQQDKVSLTTNNNKEITSRNRKEVASTIRTEMRLQRDEKMKQKPDQGKTMHLVSADKASSSFLRDGKYSTFADWRFIHRGRLNLLPINGARRGQHIDKRCRRCGRFDETLPHVLNHCMRHANTMQRRHNGIVDRLKATAGFLNWEVISENQLVPGTDQQVRPDLVLRKDNQAIVIDVACPFENGENAFEAARNLKTAKYEEVARQLRQTYNRVTIEPFVVGALGSYDPNNSSLTKKIATRRYTKTLKRLCVADTIKWSRMIYIEHITGARQY